jgi:hypothetical protein
MKTVAGQVCDFGSQPDKNADPYKGFDTSIECVAVRYRRHGFRPSACGPSILGHCASGLRLRRSVAQHRTLLRRAVDVGIGQQAYSLTRIKIARMKIATDTRSGLKASRQKRIQLVMKIMRYRQLAMLAGWEEETRQRHIKFAIERLEQELRDIDEQVSVDLISV